MRKELGEGTPSRGKRECTGPEAGTSWARLRNRNKICAARDKGKEGSEARTLETQEGVR